NRGTRARRPHRPLRGRPVSGRCPGGACDCILRRSGRTRMSGDRMRRVNEAVREVLSDAIKLLKDPRVGFVTVTDVRTSPDLRHARVYVSVLGTEDERVATMEGLASAHGVLQAAVNREL